MKKCTIKHGVPALMAALAVQGAFASGFQLLEQNASGLGNAYAGSAAVADNASTVFYNPAGMTELKTHELSIGGNAIHPSFKFTDQDSTTGGGYGGDAGNLVGLPNLYGSWAVTKDLYLGIGFNAPFGLQTKYEEGWIGRFQSTDFEIKTYNVNPSLAYRINDKVSLGLGLNWQRMEARYERQAATANIVTQNTKLKLDVDNDAWGWNAGALFHLSESTKVGVSYRSEIKHSLGGTLTASGPSSVLNTAQTGPARIDMTLPASWILSVTQTLNDRWEMLGDLSWTGWSVIQKADIVRTDTGATPQTLETKFRDTWRAALGANYKLNDQWKLKYGLAYDQTPVRNASTRLVSLPDNDRVWLTIGAQWKPTPISTVDLGAAYIHIRDAKIDNNQAASGRGRITGEYSGSIWILGAQYSLAF